MTAGKAVSSERVEPTATHEPKGAGHSPQVVCPHCSSPMAADQEWCLECGAGSTLIRTPPDWRIPVAIVLAVIAIALTGFVVALSRV